MDVIPTSERLEVVGVGGNGGRTDRGDRHRHLAVFVYESWCLPWGIMQISRHSNESTKYYYTP